MPARIQSSSPSRTGLSSLRSMVTAAYALSRASGECGSPEAWNQASSASCTAWCRQASSLSLTEAAQEMMPAATKAGTRKLSRKSARTALSSALSPGTRHRAIPESSRSRAPAARASAASPRAPGACGPIWPRSIAGAAEAPGRRNELRRTAGPQVTGTVTVVTELGLVGVTARTRERSCSNRSAASDGAACLSQRGGVDSSHGFEGSSASSSRSASRSGRLRDSMAQPGLAAAATLLAGLVLLRARPSSSPRACPTAVACPRRRKE
mmetsp:Transcript_4900/g.20979  ORF Transcript_4900/g.20979 Transcript_4900/m.20979 type:complete len:267 (-) Transcript_4900:55-855(-)